VLYFSKGNTFVVGNVGINLFWRDMASATNRAITTFDISTTVNAIAAAMTPDGQRVAYGVQTNNLTTAALYVWSAATGNTIYSNLSGSSIIQTAISPDGNLVAYYRTNQIVLINLTSQAQVSFTNAASRPGCQFSADSQTVAFALGTNQIYLYNFVTSSNVLIAAGVNGICDSPAVSPDGRFIAYRSRASNLASNDTNGVSDIYLYDAQSGTTTLVTTSPFGGASANGLSLNPVFSGDGQTLFWQSWANNLAGQDFSPWGNLYALQSFATNSAGPGQPPVITGIGLVSLAGFDSSGTGATFSWPATTNANYLLQFTDDLTNPQWQTLTNAARILGTQGYATDPVTTNSHRFYRLVTF
jgi:Tol biopolymer transport system component